VEHEAEIYPPIAVLGEKLRRLLESTFQSVGICARCTGYGNDVVAGSSLAYVHFPYREDTVLDRPEKMFDPAICDVELGTHVLQLALLLENVYMVHGHGAVSTAHTGKDMAIMEEACSRVARRIKSSLKP
jgi:glutamate-1-semialdehyde aminotransferase